MKESTDIRNLLRLTGASFEGFFIVRNIFIEFERFEKELQHFENVRTVENESSFLLRFFKGKQGHAINQTLVLYS